METKSPTIRGYFVNTHLKALKRNKGEAIFKELEKAYGRELKFGMLQNVPVGDEVRIIYLVLEKMSDAPVLSEKLDYESGRFHFQNFINSGFSRIIFPLFGKNFSMVLKVASFLAKEIFSGVNVAAHNAGVHSAAVVMENSDYPQEHFVGFFDAWLSHLGLIGMTKVRPVGPKSFEYTITWKKTA